MKETLDRIFPGLVVNGMRGSHDANKLNTSVYASWLQKSIRRAKKRQALYAACALYAFASHDKGKPLLTFLCNRLEIIALEDVGIANPYLVDSVMLRLDTVRDRPVSEKGLIVIISVVCALCDSPKSRLCSWLKNAFGRDTNYTGDVGPYAHVRCYLHMEPQAIKKSLADMDLTALWNWVNTKNMDKKSEWIYGVILLLIRPSEYKKVVIDMCTIDTCMELLESFVTKPVLLKDEMKDIVMDIHTGKRKRNDREARYDFAIRGAHIENEAVVHPCHTKLREFYNSCKLNGNEGRYPPVQEIEDGVHEMKDSDLFIPKSKLIGFKTPTFIATPTAKCIEAIKSDGDIFVKLVPHKATDFALKCHMFRSVLGLYTEPTIIKTGVLMTYEYADMAEESSQLASQRNINALKRECENVVDAFIQKKAPNAINLCNALKTNRTVDKLELMKTLLFRRYIMTTDTNSNNIVIDTHGRCLSVDENKAKPGQVDRWAKLENPDSVFTAQKNGNLPVVYLNQLKAFSQEHEKELVEFLQMMKTTKFDIKRDDEWIDRMIVSHNWF